VGTDRVIVGEITRAHGIRGGMWVRPMTDSLERGLALTEVFLVRGAEERVARVESVEIVNGDRWLVRFAGINNREAAEAMHGWSVGIVAAESPALPDGVFYVRELVGREVSTEDGRVLGTLTEVIPTGSNDVYTISGPDGDLTFPALKDLVIECPRDARTMKVRVPPGLLEACLKVRR
jgi:16S rRNA processing protein RimM